MLVPQSIDLGRAGTHDVVRGRNVLVVPIATCQRGRRADGAVAAAAARVCVRLLLGNLGVEDLAVVLHTLDVLVQALSLGLCHGGVDVPVGEHVLCHFNGVFEVMICGLLAEGVLAVNDDDIRVSFRCVEMVYLLDVS